MTQGTYICFNGEFRRSAEPVLFSQDRAFRYGDILFENMHACSTEIQFPGLHLQRLFSNMKLLKMEIPSFLNEGLMKGLVQQLLNKNRIFGGAHIRLSVFRRGAAGFIPENHSISFILESEKLEQGHYVLNDIGYVVDTCSEWAKPAGPLACIRNAHTFLYLLAGIECSKAGLDETLLINEKGRLVESVHSNLFLVSGDAVFTPGITQGCIPGVMRQVVAEVAGKAGYRVNDQSNLTPAALEDAEEVFLTNAIEGIRWVSAYKQRRYYKKTIKVLVEKLNEMAFGSSQVL
jgi:branched-chain amino acid aminotransferase